MASTGRRTDDPSGHNGFVKIEHVVGGSAGIPDNNPHQPCQLSVEWYNYDRGDLLSRVDFSPMAPTRDAVISVDGPTSVQVGEDSASGGSKDPDAAQVYGLAFEGEPASQGFHVKLVVTTPGPHGAERKSKVFWVEPCRAGSAVAPPSTGAGSRAEPAVAAPGARPQASVVPREAASPLDGVRSSPELAELSAVDAGLAPVASDEASGWSARPLLGVLGLILLGLGLVLLARLLGAGSPGRHRR